MSQFTQYSAVLKLKSLAEHPYDLTKKEALNPKRLINYCAESAGLKLLYGTERIDDRTLEAFKLLAEESSAIKKMHQMQNGELINTIEGYESENRPVLHTAMRDIFNSPNHHKAAKEAAELTKLEHQKLKNFIDKINNSNKFTNLIMVGIGGSDLGPRALFLALQKYRKSDRHVHFITNVDPDDAALILNDLNLSKTIVVVVSKSGTTLETLTNEEIIRQRYSQQGLNPKEYFIAVTGKGSQMDNPNAYLERFYIWDYVGGRYSATSMVGGVMLSFGLGYENFVELLKGAHEMDKQALVPNLDKNISLISALIGIWNRNFLNYPTLAVIPYSQALSRFPAHLQQCDMESNGKRIDKQGNTLDYETGPVIWGEPGTNGQHSFFQLLHQGSSVVPVEFIGFKESQFQEDLSVQGTTSQQKLLANLFAQSLALAEGQKSNNPNREFLGNRPNHIILGKQLTPFTLGALLSYYENKIAFQGFIWNINSFDQEGVQLGKRLANRILDLFESKKEGMYPSAEALLSTLE